jgi:transcriptional regulator
MYISQLIYDNSNKMPCTITTKYDKKFETNLKHSIALIERSFAKNIKNWYRLTIKLADSLKAKIKQN